MTSLPSFFVLRHGGRYLSVQKNRRRSFPPGALIFDDEDIWSPRVKFAAEKSESRNGKLVNIRCCYNNKYWAVHEFQGRLWIAASADKPQEDRKSPACTLFRATEYETSSGKAGFRLLCVNKDMYALDVEGGLELEEDGYSTFRTIDWETLVKLPSHVAFKYDGHYLCSLILDSHYNYLRFESGLEVTDPWVAHEVFPTPNGNYRIKDLHTGNFWRRSPNWIWADAEEEDHSDDTLFSFEKLSDNVFAVRNLGNGNYCGGLTTEGKENCLNAHYPTKSRRTRLIVEEAVRERKISDVKFRLSDSRIYGEEIVEIDCDFPVNHSRTRDLTITSSFTTTETTTTSWNNSVSVNVGVNVELEVDFIPFVVDGKIGLTAGIEYKHEWGGAVSTSRTRECSGTVTLPPKTRMKVILMCTTAAYDVPYSYLQHDHLANGEWVTTAKDDGLYSGINSYNFHCESFDVDY